MARPAGRAPRSRADVLAARAYRRTTAIVAWLLLASASCRPAARTGDAADAARAEKPGSAAPDGSARPVDGGPSEAPARVPLQLLRFTLTSGVQGKEPVDRLESARPGQRVWAHATVRNRTGASRRIGLAFSVNGEARTRLDLDVEESWSYRTWGYATLRGTDHGELRVVVADDTGATLAEGTLPIRK